MYHKLIYCNVMQCNVMWFVVWEEIFHIEIITFLMHHAVTVLFLMDIKDFFLII